MLAEVLLQFGGVQAVRDVAKVQETNGARWIDTPGLAKDLTASIGVQRELAASPRKHIIPDLCLNRGEQRFSRSRKHARLIA